MVIFTAQQNLNEVKIYLIVKFANLAGKSYIISITSEGPKLTLDFVVVNEVYYSMPINKHDAWKLYSTETNALFM